MRFNIKTLHYGQLPIKSKNNINIFNPDYDELMNSIEGRLKEFIENQRIGYADKDCVSVDASQVYYLSDYVITGTEVAAVKSVCMLLEDYVEKHDELDFI